jgi:hypothetical protein
MSDYRWFAMMMVSTPTDNPVTKTKKQKTNVLMCKTRDPQTTMRSWNAANTGKLRDGYSSTTPSSCARSGKKENDGDDDEDYAFGIDFFKRSNDTTTTMFAHPSNTNNNDDCGDALYVIGEVIGPFASETEVDKYIFLWQRQTLSLSSSTVQNDTAVVDETVTKAAKGVALAERYNYRAYLNFSAFSLAATTTELSQGS